MSVVARDVYNARRAHNLPCIHDGHGDSPRRPRQSHFRSTSPLPFLLSHGERAPQASTQMFYSDDVFR